jgi:hypothetical protein
VTGEAVGGVAGAASTSGRADPGTSALASGRACHSPCGPSSPAASASAHDCRRSAPGTSNAVPGRGAAIAAHATSESTATIARRITRPLSDARTRPVNRRCTSPPEPRTIGTIRPPNDWSDQNTRNHRNDPNARNDPNQNDPNDPNQNDPNDSNDPNDPNAQ